jgi:hypothetical protein
MRDSLQLADHDIATIWLVVRTVGQYRQCPSLHYISPYVLGGATRCAAHGVSLMAIELGLKHEMQHEQLSPASCWLVAWLCQSQCGW